MTSYSGKYVVQMAVDIERVGQEFYESLAEGCDNPQVAALCRRLAKVEAGHRAQFSLMYDRIAKPGVDVPMDDAQRTQAEELVRSQIMPAPEEVRKVGLGGGVKDAVAMAMRLEQGSIDFYTRMLAVLPSDRDAVAEIIDQERGHLRALQAIAV